MLLVIEHVTQPLFRLAFSCYWHTTVLLKALLLAIAHLSLIIYRMFHRYCKKLETLHYDNKSLGQEIFCSNEFKKF